MFEILMMSSQKLVVGKISPKFSLHLLLKENFQGLGLYAVYCTADDGWSTPPPPPFPPVTASFF